MPFPASAARSRRPGTVLGTHRFFFVVQVFHGVFLVLGSLNQRFPACLHLVAQSPQAIDLIQRQSARFARGQTVQQQWADLQPDQPQHLVPQLGQHPTDLAVLPLRQNNAQPGAFPLTLQFLNRFRAHPPLGQVNALQQFLQVLGSRGPSHQHAIGLLHLVTRVSQPQRHFPVVGHQQQAFAVGVQPAHRVDPLGNMRK